jgi:hypothetical protein
MSLLPPRYPSRNVGWSLDLMLAQDELARDFQVGI